MKFIVNAFLPIFTLVSFSVNAAIAIDRTRVIFDGNVKSLSINITNQNNKLPYLAQAWIEDENGLKIQDPFIALPPVQRVEPGKSSQVKIQGLATLSKLAQNRETVFYFNLREIPPRSSSTNSLQIALQTRIKLFYRPSVIKSEMNMPSPYEKITLTKSNNKVFINNKTPYYFSLISVRNGKNKDNIKDFEPIMISPFNNSPIGINANLTGEYLTLTYVNDFGGRPDLLFHCIANECTVKK